MSAKYFGTDGIRDASGQGLLAADHVQAYGRAVGRWLGQRGSSLRILVGRDTRRSGAEILDQLAIGLVGASHRLVDGGILSTPAVQTLCREERFDLAIVISASHNPAQDNGIKFFGSDGRKLQDQDESSIEALIRAELEKRTVLTKDGGARMKDPGAVERYLRFLRVEAFPNLDLRGVRLVVDCAHGAASDFAPRFLRELGASLQVRGASPNGDNINLGVGVFNVEELGPLVREQQAALGLALDGDADRVLLVDETGLVRDGDHMLGVLAEDAQKRGDLPGQRIVTTVMANLGLKVFLRERGIACDMVPVGDRNVSARMDETGASIGGEQSGHIIFRSGPRWFGDGLYTALRILEILRRRQQPLSALAQGIEKYPQVLVNVKVKSKPKLDEVPDLVRLVKDAESKLGDQGRVLLRYSGTEPLLRVMIEGKHLAEVTGLTNGLADCARRLFGT